MQHENSAAKHLPQPRCHHACVAFQARVHLVWAQARRYSPGDQIGEPILSDESGERRDAVVGIAHHPALRDALLLGNAGNAAVAAGFRAEAVVDRHPAMFGVSHGDPVALGIVGDQAGANDADAVVGRVAAAGFQLLMPRIERADAWTLRQQVDVETRRSLRTVRNMNRARS